MTQTIADSCLDHIIGESTLIREVKDRIRRLAPRPIPVLIQGPTGSGKELVARALHSESGRAGRFVAFNICAVPEAVFESALFGHVRGAFTGAVSNAAGYLVEADGGTLFLDEIGGLPLTQQAKLLRVLETREFRPVGASRDRQSDFRVVASTNEPLADLVHSGRFRADLAFRLAAFVIDVPPLRERRIDIARLAVHFVELSAGRPATRSLSPDALRRLEESDWPGNVRELRNVVDRALALTDEHTIGVGDLFSSTRPGPRVSNGSAVVDLARRRLLDELDDCDWDVAEVGQRLGVHWTTIYRRMRKLGIARRRAAVAETPVQIDESIEDHCTV